MAKASCLMLLLLLTTWAAAAGAEWPNPPVATPRTEPLEIQVYFPAIPFDGSVDVDAAVRMEESIARSLQDLLTALLPFGSVSGSYEIDFDEGPLLSLTFTYSAYRRAMAHPMHFSKSLTFDVRTGQRLTLDDLFTGDYLGVLSDRIAEQIEADELPLLRPFDGIDASADFRITTEGLVIYFQLYDLVPYAWGFPQFRIPYSDLTDFVSEPYRDVLLGADAGSEK